MKSWGRERALDGSAGGGGAPHRGASRPRGPGLPAPSQPKRELILSVPTVGERFFQKTLTAVKHEPQSSVRRHFPRWVCRQRMSGGGQHQALSPTRSHVSAHDGFSLLPLWKRLRGEARGTAAPADPRTAVRAHTDSRTDSDKGPKATCSIA